MFSSPINFRPKLHYNLLSSPLPPKIANLGHPRRRQQLDIVLAIVDGNLPEGFHRKHRARFKTRSTSVSSGALIGPFGTFCTREIAIFLAGCCGEIHCTARYFLQGAIHSGIGPPLHPPTVYLIHVTGLEKASPGFFPRKKNFRFRFRRTRRTDAAESRSIGRAAVMMTLSDHDQNLLSVSLSSLDFALPMRRIQASISLFLPSLFLVYVSLKIFICREVNTKRNSKLC